MTRHSNIRSKFYEYLRNELLPADRIAIETHVAACKECANELETIREALAAFSAPESHASEGQTGEFWDAFASRITKNAIEQPPVQRNLFVETIDWLIESFYLHRRYTYTASGALAVMLIGLAFWMFAVPEKRELTLDGTSTPLEHQAELSSSDEVMNRGQIVPVERVGQYFRKSKMLLVGLTNMKTNEGEPLDFSAERRVSSDLIREARYLKQQPIDPRSRQVMKDLERILIKIKNIEEQHDLPDVEIIRGGIHQENLLFKIRMAEAMYDSSNFVYASDHR